MELDGEVNQNFPEFSDKIKVMSNETVGRYIIAQDDIKAFETVLCEEAYAAVLHPEKYGTNCYHCLKRFKTAIGSKVCANVAFCW